jgi:hypothetical protein
VRPVCTVVEGPADRGPRRAAILQKLLNDSGEYAMPAEEPAASGGSAWRLVSGTVAVMTAAVSTLRL